MVYSFLLLIFLLCGSCVSTEWGSKSSFDVFSEDDSCLVLFAEIEVSSPDLLTAYDKLADNLVSQILVFQKYYYHPEIETVVKRYLKDLIKITFNQKLASGENSQRAFIDKFHYNREKGELKGISAVFVIKKDFYDLIRLRIEPMVDSLTLKGWVNLLEQLKLNWEMAVFATEGNIPENFPYVLSYLQRAENLLKDFNFILKQAPQKTKLNEKNEVPFILRVQKEDGDPVSGVPISIFWRDLDGSGLLAWQSRLLETGKNGEIVFHLPALLSVNGTKISFEFSKSLFPLSRSLPEGKSLSLLNAFLEKVSARNITRFLELDLDLAVGNSKTGVLLVQSDLAGNVATGSNVAEIFIASMGEEKGEWHLFELPYFNLPEIEDKNSLSKEYLQFLLEQLPDDIEHLLVGLVSLSSFDEQDSLYQVATVGDIFVFHRNGKLLYQTEITATSRGNDVGTVISLAWRSFGRNLANNLSGNLFKK